MTMAEHWFKSLFALILAGHVMAGAWLSTTVTVKEQFAVWLAASVTTKVLVVVPTGKVELVGKPTVCTVTAPGQLSAPTGLTNVTVAPQNEGVLFTVMLAGQVMDGNCKSLTVIVNEQEAVCPLAAVTTNVLVVTPLGNAAPEARPTVWLTVKPPQLSLAFGAA